MAKIDTLLRKLHELEGSDLHILAGQPPKFRVHGALEPVTDQPLDNAAVETLLYEIMDDKKRQVFDEVMDVDFAYEVPGVARFRVNYFRHLHGMGGVFRTIPTRIRSLAELGVPEVCYRFAEMRSGLVLVTGPTGSGKSTTLAAIIDHINRNQARHIITIEEPIEYTHENQRSVVTQREVGEDARSFAAALRAAMREDGDVVLVGELRDLETISLAITAAEMGNIVFATLHTNSAAKTIDRIIDVFPEDQQDQVRTMLSVSLQGVVSQLLLRRADGQGRVPANEILLGSPALGNIIREGAVAKINQYIESGRGEGMQLMDDAIMGHLMDGTITGEEAYLKAFDKSRFERYYVPEEL
ncbi:MAG: type IV pilus twitching motility protein PilT [Planctomycetota bacterium]|nr:MAG: type IV pilus twitching motility protein PilT [Planctomycetota bacterium]